MIRRRSRSPLGHPLILGALAVMALVYGSYISFRANSGLPFQPTYHLTLDLPDAAQVFKQADVNMAGERIGSVSSITVVPRAGDRPPVAQLKLAIDKRYEPLPADTTATVGISGTLGAKYVELTPGTSTRTLKEGATLPLRQARPSVEIDQLLDTFTPKARQGIRSSLDGLGLGFAGRGEDINLALGVFPALLADLEPVARNLADPMTGLARFVRAISAFAGELGPVADRTASLFRDLATTFGALGRVATPSLQQTISRTPPALDAVITQAPRINTLLSETTRLFAGLRPGVAHLPHSAPITADALGAGARNLPLLPGLDQRLDTLLTRVSSFAQSPDVLTGIDRLTLTFAALQPLVSDLAPAQTTCNDVALFARNLGSLFKEGIATGTMVRAGGVVVGVQNQNERGPAQHIFTGPVAKAMGPLHANPYPDTASPGQRHVCEAGHEPYVYNKPVIGNAPGVPSARTEEATLP